MEKSKLIVPTPVGILTRALQKATSYAIGKNCSTIHLDLIVLYSLRECLSLQPGEVKESGGELTWGLLNKGEVEKDIINNLLDKLEECANNTLDDEKIEGELISNNASVLGADVLSLFKCISLLKESNDDYINSNPIDEISVDDIIYGIISFPDDFKELNQIFTSSGINTDIFLFTRVLKTLFRTVDNIAGNQQPLSDMIDPIDSSEFEAAGKAMSEDLHTKKIDPDSETPTLDEFGIDMTKQAGEGKYDKVIGRENEVSQLIQILCCRKKNNAIIIGKAGTGKTALVEHLAQLMSEGKVPEEIKGKRLISLSTTTLTAGTKYRGQLEQRVQDICTEVANNKNIIIFIDEFHSAVSNYSSDDISQMLKPSLSRGELTLIAGTTVDEYKKYIEKDSALKRRFQKIYLEEPTKEETLQILLGLRDKYSEYHKVGYPDEILELCVSLSSRYFYDRNSPDSAIDLMDISGSLAKLSHPSKKSGKMESLEKKIENIKKKKLNLVKGENYEEANKEYEKQQKLEKELDSLKNSINANNKVTKEDVASVVSSLVNIPVDTILSPDINKLGSMAPRLKEKIIGQDESIDMVTKLLSRQFLGLRDENIPPSLYISGGTGTGKTYLAEEVAKTIFGSEKAMLRIDCGELTQPHTVTKLIGAPPSYVGFGEVALFDSIRERPQRLVLVDEADKLCPEILNTIFLNILTTGFITLSNGIEVSFKDCIIIFTSNDGTRDLEAHGSGIGFGTEDKKTVTKDIVMKAIKRRIRPEVLNRFSGIVVFNNLGKPEMEKIYELELNKVKERLLNKGGLILTVKKEIRDKIISELDLNYGARDLTRGIAKYVEDPICDVIIKGSDDKKKRIEVGLSKTGEIEVKLKK